MVAASHTRKPLYSVVVGSSNGSVHVWTIAANSRSLATDKPRHCVFSESGTGVIDAVAFDPNSNLVFSASDTSIHIFDLRSRRKLRSLYKRQPAVRAILLLPPAPDGTNRLASINSSSTITIWNIMTGQEIASLAPPIDGTAVYRDACHNGNMLALLCGNRCLLWDLSVSPPTCFPISTSSLNIEQCFIDGTNLLLVSRLIYVCYDISRPMQPLRTHKQTLVLGNPLAYRNRCFAAIVDRRINIIATTYKVPY